MADAAWVVGCDLTPHPFYLWARLELLAGHRFHHHPSGYDCYPLSGAHAAYPLNMTNVRYREEGTSFRMSSMGAEPTANVVAVQHR